MARQRDAIDVPAHGSPADSYWRVARQPLQILVFLLPLIVLYEISLAWQLRTRGDALTNVAHESLLEFFESLGVGGGGLYLGGIVIVVVLLIWHVLTRDPWRIHRGAVGLMALESIALMPPLLVLGLLVQRGLEPAIVPTPGNGFSELNFWSRMSVSVGAGLYEELLFRMLLIAIVHTLLVDLAGRPDGVGIAVAVVVSAAAFTWYHPLDVEGSISARKVIFYFLAGLYLGAVYVARGFGIVVAVHALYDVVTVAILPAPAV